LTDKEDDVWTTRDFPVLREVVRRFDRGDNTVWGQDVAAALSMSPEDVARSARALRRRGLVEALIPLQGPAVQFSDVSGDAYLYTGLHPDGNDLTERLISALRQAADQVDDPKEKTRLQRAAKALGEVTKSVASGVITAAITGGMN
jgi:hypothetical protein